MTPADSEALWPKRRRDADLLAMEPCKTDEACSGAFTLFLRPRAVVPGRRFHTTNSLTRFISFHGQLTCQGELNFSLRALVVFSGHKLQPLPCLKSAAEVKLHRDRFFFGSEQSCGGRWTDIGSPRNE